MKTEVNLPIAFPSTIYENDIEAFDRVLLALHGYQLDGRFMYKRFEPLVSSSAKVIAPNAPFLVPLNKGEKWEPRYGWYFYDSFKRNFYIDYEPAARWLADLIKLRNPDSKPVTIVGYSQGGFLAPKVAELVPEADKVIGINAIFRSERFAIKDIEYVQVNGAKDEIVSCEEARLEFNKLKEKGAIGKFEIFNEGHLLNQALLKKTSRHLA